jgi:prefoldin beta subunit
MMQKQQIELEIVETERALEELSKTNTSDSIYKAAGPLLIKSDKDTIEKDLTEKKELANTRVMVLGKQELRVKENLKEVENKINQMLKGTQSTTQNK